MTTGAPKRREAPSFRFSARAILELGAELISSDGIALYELLKNSVDAGSPHVRIEVRQVLGTIRFRKLIDDLDQRVGQMSDLPEDERAFVEGRHVDAVRDALQAIVERTGSEAAHAIVRRLVAPRSTLATLRRALERVRDRVDSIMVRDVGEGMSTGDLVGKFLVVGTASRRNEKVAARAAGDRPKRAFLGDKGVGRLSAMRLGDLLSIETSRSAEPWTHVLEIDWERFGRPSDTRVEDISFRLGRGAPKADASSSGTIITIRRLKGDWGLDRFRAITTDDFARFINPFDTNAANDLLRLYHNGERQYVPEMDPRLFEVAHAEVSASFGYDGRVPYLRGYLNYRLRGRERPFALGEPELRGLLGENPYAALLALGPFSMEMWWYNRPLLRNVDGFGKKAEISKLVKKWSGGLMLFRDGFRVNPYGSAEDDWLGLDKSAFSSKGFKLNRQQVIGRVDITWRNAGLVEQTNREGLIDTPEKRVLMGLLQHVVFGQFKEFLDLVDKEVREIELNDVETLESNAAKTREEVERKVRELIVRVPEEREALHELVRLTKKLNEYIGQARRLAEDYETDRAKFVYLAGVGLMVEVVLHELGRATSHTLRTLQELEGRGSTGATPAVLDNLSEQLGTIVRRIASLDPLSTSRRQTKKGFSILGVVESIVEARSAQAARHDVEIRIIADGADGWEVVGVEGMFIQIMENLLSNSFYWLEVQRMIEPDLEAWIVIEVDAQATTVTITDNGTGVEPSTADEIFEAFKSHRPTKEGKGLGLYISREVAEYHDWTLDLARTPGPRKGRYNTFVLDMSGQRS